MCGKSRLTKGAKAAGLGGCPFSVSRRRHDNRRSVGPYERGPALIEILSKMKLDEHIPGECYRVVAEILAWIYKAQLHSAEKLR